MLQYSAIQQSESSICMQISPLLRISFPLRSLQGTGRRFLVYTVGSHYLFYTCINSVYMRQTVVLLLSCVRFFFNPMDYSPPGSSVHGIIQARTLEWVAVSSSIPDPGIKPESPALAGGFSTTEPPGKSIKTGKIFKYY